jgi:septal ring factor EnvC (AmiA/AmiB activator)
VKLLVVGVLLVLSCATWLVSQMRSPTWRRARLTIFLQDYKMFEDLLRDEQDSDRRAHYETELARLSKKIRQLQTKLERAKR